MPRPPLSEKSSDHPAVSSTSSRAATLRGLAAMIGLAPAKGRDTPPWRPIVLKLFVRIQCPSQPPKEEKGDDPSNFQATGRPDRPAPEDQAAGAGRVKYCAKRDVQCCGASHKACRKVRLAQAMEFESPWFSQSPVPPSSSWASGSTTVSGVSDRNRNGLIIVTSWKKMRGGPRR